MKCSSFGVGYPDLQNKLTNVGQFVKTLAAQYVRVAQVLQMIAYLKKHK